MWWKMANQSVKDVFATLQTTTVGLRREDVERRRDEFGENIVVHEQKKSIIVLLCNAFINPFIGVLTVLVIISLILDVLTADPGSKDWTGPIIISVMVVASTILRFWQEWKAGEATEGLMKMVKNTCTVKRAEESTWRSGRYGVRRGRRGHPEKIYPPRQRSGVAAVQPRLSVLGFGGR